jgi:glycyl-tRNA synthetase
MFESLVEEELEKDETRIVMKINPMLAPIKVNVLPLVNKRHSEKSREIYDNLRQHFMVSIDESGNIGKRYRRGDAIGTPFAITIDDQTLENNTVTVRDRDDMQQIVVNVEQLVSYIQDKIESFRLC